MALPSDESLAMILLYIAGIIASYYVAKLLKAVVIRGMGSKKPSLASILGIMINVSAAIVASILVFDMAQIVYPELGQATVMLAYAAGAITVIFGLAAQNSLGHIIAGIVMVFSQAIRVGDVLEYNGSIARVEDITLTHTRLVTLDGRRIVIPNQILLNKELVNYSLGKRRVAAVVDVGISYESNVELAIKAMLEAALDHPRILPKPYPVVIVKGFGENSVNLRLYAYIEHPWLKPIVESELIIEIHKRFKEYGVEIPYPRRVVIMRDKTGSEVPKSIVSEEEGVVES